MNARVGRGSLDICSAGGEKLSVGILIGSARGVLCEWDGFFSIHFNRQFIMRCYKLVINLVLTYEIDSARSQILIN